MSQDSKRDIIGTIGTFTNYAINTPIAPIGSPVKPDITKLGLSRDQVLVLRSLAQDRSIAELMTLLERSNRTKFRDQVLNPLLDAGLAEMTIPDKPRSSKQRYRLTDKGRKVLAESKEIE